MYKTISLIIMAVFISYAQTNVTMELDKRLARLDTLQTQVHLSIIKIPDTEQLKQLAIQARDIELQRSVYLSLKMTFTDSLWLKQDSLATEPKNPPH